MPIFEYRCKKCQCEFESFVLSAHDREGIQCPKCGDIQVEKLLSCFSRTGASNAGTGAACSPGKGSLFS